MKELYPRSGFFFSFIILLIAGLTLQELKEKELTKPSYRE
jgi:hypothetical protein